MQQAKQSKRKPNKTRNVSFMSKTAQLFSKARIFSFNSASVIANAVKKTAAVKGLDLSEVRDYTFALAKSILGFLLGMAALPQGIRPFGISLLCSMSDSRSVFFTYIGCALSCITYGDSALSSFIVYFMLFAARKAFTESKYGEQLNVRILESAAASTAIGIIRISTSAEHAVYSYIAFLCLACISCAFTYFFSILFNKAALSAARISTKSICSYALMGALVCSLSGVNVLGFDLQLVAACLITLTYAVANGFLHAGIVGFICGIACASPIVSASLGLSGIIAALMFSKSIFASLISFACAFLICGAYSADLGYTETITVPRNWQTVLSKGYDVPQYTNVNYPFPVDPPHIPDKNPCAVYTRDFYLSDGFAEKSVYLNFEGVDSCHYVWINGKFVGYSTVSHCTSEFDVSGAVKAGRNIIAVLVVKWNAQSYLEDQDMFRFSGIFREVYLLARDKNHIRDIYVKQSVSDDLGKAELCLELDFVGKAKAEYTLLAPNNDIIAEGEYVKDKTVIEIQNPVLWNDESPKLYKLIIYCGSEVIYQNIAVKQVKIVGKVFYINGK